MPDGHWYEQMYGPRDARLLPLEPGHKYFLADPRAPKSGDLLDVGCGTGNFLVAAHSAGFQVTGTELDPGAVRFIHTKLGIESVVPLTITAFTAANPARKFSVVTSFEVLEHQADPVAFVRAIKSCLVAHGYIAMSVPNRNRWLTGPDVLDYPPNHFLRWSPAALKNFLVANGFEILSLREQHAGISHTAQMINMALRTGLSRPIAGSVQPAFREVMQMPAEQAATLLAARPTPRQRLFSALSKGKLGVCHFLAIAAWPVVRLQQRKGTYLYCLARSRD
jgi:SAM-dependent methyltransferase